MSHREEWERILQKIRTGEMPPKGMPRPPAAQTDALMKFVHEKWEAADRNVAPDPGRVTARRLNRNEYSNTIRDLLGVDFRAERDFPTDDSGYGFDNIGDVLTISPVLMEKYISAAERIAARAIGADPLPKKPLTAEYSRTNETIAACRFLNRRSDPSGRLGCRVRDSHRLARRARRGRQAGHAGDLDGRQEAATRSWWKRSHRSWSISIRTPKKRSALYLPEGDHNFRVGVHQRRFREGLLTEKEAYNTKKNKYIGLDAVRRSVSRRRSRKPSRKKILICDPNTGGNACVDKIISTLARRAYRRPVTKAKWTRWSDSSAMAKAEGQSVEQGIQLAIQAMLVSPHFLFRIERDPGRDPAKVHPITDIELASRLSYFLWSSMPDDELLQLAEAGKLRGQRLDAQVKRMLADHAIGRASPTISPASGWRRATSIASSPIRRSFPSGDRSCAMR